MVNSKEVLFESKSDSVCVGTDLGFYPHVNATR